MKTLNLETTSVLTASLVMLAVTHLSAATLYVSLDSPNPSPPYATWATAAHVIQDAVDASHDGDTVLVTNGVYAVGEREVTSRVVVTNAIRLESVNGPAVTTIDGFGAWTNELGEVVKYGSCAHVGDGAILSGFTLTNGQDGGVYCQSLGVVTNCVITGNRNTGAYGGTYRNCIISDNVGARGGGVCSATLFNCVVRDNYCGGSPNSCYGDGGGALNCILHDCTLTANRARDLGGGAAFSTLYNCTLTGNSTGSGGGTHGGTAYSCYFTANSAWTGGAASAGILCNCTLVGNLADYGGGVFGGTLYNSIAYYNTAAHGPNYFTGTEPAREHYGVDTVLNFCCTSPLPAAGIGNIAGPPLFMDLAAGDFRLREESPCIDAGTNLLGRVFNNVVWEDGFGQWITNFCTITYPTDILGNTRFIDGNGDGKVAWDIGAYEFYSFKPPRFAVQPQRTAEGWVLNITGAPNKWVQLQRSGDLRNWDDVGPSVYMGEAGVGQLIDNDPQGAMFYRAMSVP